MTDKELRKLSRANLLEMLVEMKKENDELTKKLEAAQNELNSRKIKLSKAGSIAEASLELNGVFEAAEKAAAQYLENLADATKNQQEYRDRMEAETHERCKKMIARTEAKCREREKLAENRYRSVLVKIKAICDENPELAKKLMGSTRRNDDGKK